MIFTLDVTEPGKFRTPLERIIRSLDPNFSLYWYCSNLEVYGSIAAAAIENNLGRNTGLPVLLTSLQLDSMFLERANVVFGDFFAVNSELAKLVASVGITEIVDGVERGTFVAGLHVVKTRTFDILVNHPARANSLIAAFPTITQLGTDDY